jgi:subtilisin family serine protease
MPSQTLRQRTILALLAPPAMALAVASPASAQPARPAYPNPDGAGLVRLLGARAMAAFAPPGARGLGALVRLPAGTSASALGLREMAPGIGRFWGSADALLAFADQHPDLTVEVSPVLHTLLNTAAKYIGSQATVAQGMNGNGALIGIADTGIDVTHPDFIDALGHTRVAWLLDLSSPPRGVHPDLEAQFGTMDSTTGALAAGAVWSAADIDAARASGAAVPQDPVGHGTLVASCAAGSGALGTSPYVGVAPGATLVVASVTGSGADAIGNDDLLRGVGFLFDRADSMGEPIAVNLSIGTDFGPHDGTTAWEQTLASFVGPDKPGHAIVAAAGNSGSIVDTPVHENVHVNSGSTMRVPIVTSGAQDGGIDVWVAMHAGADLRVGLDAPDGTWIDPVASGTSGAKDGAGRYVAGIYNGSPSGSPVPTSSHGAVVAWQGAWGSGTYYVTLQGTGTADLYMQTTGDASSDLTNVGFQYGVRETTINLPASSPSIIGVGCSINKSAWRSIDGDKVGLSVPRLDSVGASPDPQMRSERAVSGEPCWFSSAGPTLTGLLKPEVLAPGAAIVGALSAQAPTSSPESIFFTAECPVSSDGVQRTTCQQIDATHGASEGTSFSSPLVAGAIAVLFQLDPTLTQDTVVAALQAGAHPVRHGGVFQDQLGAGELDVPGALTALEWMHHPGMALPDRSASWLVVGADTVLADGSTPLEALLQLRSSPDGGAPSPADGFDSSRLSVYAQLDGQTFAQWPCDTGGTANASCQRKGPGLWRISLQLAGGLGGQSLALGATFDGADIVDPRSIPIATDTWNAAYPPQVAGGACATGTSPLPRSSPLAPGSALAVLAGIVTRRRALRARRRARPT